MAQDFSALPKERPACHKIIIIAKGLIMDKFSLEKIQQARQRLDLSSRGIDEEYYGNLLKSALIVPAKPPESDWEKLAKWCSEVGITAEEVLKILQEVRDKKGNS